MGHTSLQYFSLNSAKTIILLGYSFIFYRFRQLIQLTMNSGHLQFISLIFSENSLTILISMDISNFKQNNHQSL